jgi:DnaJ-domain-containing protein 1
LDGLKDEGELRALEAERQQLEKRLQIEQIKKQMADLNKPDPPPPPPPPSAKELREQLRREADEIRRELDEREREILRAIKETKADPTLSKEQKQRKLNMLEDQLAEIHEQQARLL